MAKSNLLKKLRKEKELSQLELAKRSGVSNSKISLIESRKIDFYEGWQVKIANALGVEKEELWKKGDK